MNHGLVPGRHFNSGATSCRLGLALLGLLARGLEKVARKGVVCCYCIWWLTDDTPKIESVNALNQGLYMVIRVVYHGRCTNRKVLGL